MYARFVPALFCLTLWLGSMLSAVGSTVASADQINAAMPAPQTQSWWTERHERAVARIQQGPVDLLFIGDSITQGWEEDGRRVWDAYYGHRQAVNLATTAIAQRMCCGGCSRENSTALLPSWPS